VLSRLIGIHPGILFGIVLAVAFATELKQVAEAKLALLTVGLSMVIGLSAWFVYSSLSAQPATGFWHLLTVETLAAITVEALATMCIVLLPLKFLDGKSIFAWSKWGWAGSYVVALGIFVLVIAPLSGNWGAMSTPLMRWGAFFGAFAIMTVVIYLIYRRPSPKVA
jgi:hypothetical protein